MLRPVTVIGLDKPPAEPVAPPLLDTQVAVYPVTALPPLLDGPVNATAACVLPRVAVPIVGAPGSVAGTTAFDEADAEPVPTEFVAVTVHV